MAISAMRGGLLASPDESAFALQGLSNHVINQSVLVPDVKGLEVFAIGLLIHFLKDLEKTTVIPAAIEVSDNKILGKLR